MLEKQKNRVHEVPAVAARTPVPKNFFVDPWNHND